MGAGPRSVGRGGDPLPAGERPALPADPLARLQRRWVRRRQQPRPAAPRQLRGRTDFDVRAFWTLQNLGFGNLALQKQRRAEIGEALGEQSRMINQIRREVAAARARGRWRPASRSTSPAASSPPPSRLPRGPRPHPGHDRPADRGDQQPRSALRGPPEPSARDHRLQPGPVPALRRPRLAAAPGAPGGRPPAPRSDRLAPAAARPPGREPTPADTPATLPSPVAAAPASAPVN